MKIDKIYTFLVFLFIIFIAVIFRNWFTPTYLSSGDWIYYWPQFIKQISFLGSWDIRNTGMGASMLPTLWLESYTTGTIHFATLLGWQLYERIFWYFPYLIMASLSSFYLYKHFFQDKKFGLLSPVIFIGNTYALLLVGGGQMGIALGYACVGICFILFDRLIQKCSLINAILLGLGFSMLTIFDIRVVYMLIVALFLYVLFVFSSIKKNFFSIILNFCLSAIIVIGIHMFWLLPTFFSRGSAFGQFSSVYTSVDAVRFFSFATFENSISLLHPNWPENIFGKVGFMKPEFLLLPILAYSSLFFVSTNKKEKKQTLYILYFVVLGLVGAFLAKGANDPFGTFYVWLFSHVPGFILFRDPTKWYFFVALSYSVLIPESLKNIYEFLRRKLL